MIKSQAYDAVKDFAPVGIVGNSAFVVLVKNDFPAKTLQELIATAKALPGGSDATADAVEDRGRVVVALAVGVDLAVLGRVPNLAATADECDRAHDEQ